MAADSYSLSLLAVMDRLWFHQIILFSQSNTTALLVPETFKQPELMATKSLTHPSLSSCISLSTFTNQERLSSKSPLLGDRISPAGAESLTAPLMDNSSHELEHMDSSKKKKPTRLKLSTSRARSHPPSPSTTQKRNKTMRHSGSSTILPKSMSLGGLELVEIKGFMDRGFIFRKEHLNPRMISVVPGLQRLGRYQNKPNTNLKDSQEVEDDKQIREEEEERGIIRPYLSEAWLIKRPNSPLLNLRVPRVSAAADMKKHLKFWARTVASENQQES